MVMLVVVADGFSVEAVLVDDNVLVARRARLDSAAAALASRGGVALGPRGGRRGRGRRLLCRAENKMTKQF